MRFVSLSLWIVLSFAGVLCAHGDIQQRIQLLDQDISRDPQNANLYLQRGELRRELGQLASALQDCSRAVVLEPELKDAILCRGTVYLELDQVENATLEFDRYLALYPNHLPARLRRATALVKLQRYNPAIEDFQFLLSKSPSPEIYLQTAETLLLANPDRPDVALQTIEEGLRKIGPIITLQEFALQLQVERKQYHRALATVDDILATAPRKERWLMEKGDILLLSNQMNEGCALFHQARESLVTLTPLHETGVELQQQLDSKLQQCDRGKHREK